MTQRLMIREGDTSFGTIIGTINPENGEIRAGNGIWGEVIAHIDGDRIRATNNPYGNTLFTMEGDNIRMGNQIYNPIVAHIDRQGDKIYIREGNDPWGRIIANITPN